MTTPRNEPHRQIHEHILADALVDVATELRLVDPMEFILMIRGDQAANIADLVNSSSELFFKSGALRYALAAGCSLRWESTPTVSLDMEFRHDAVCVFFRLMIGRARAAVEVLDVFFDDQEALVEAGEHQRLQEAISDARLAPLAAPPA
jgi:hypothetical protein